MTTEKKNNYSPDKKLYELIKACIKFGSDFDGRITKTKLAKLVYLADFVFYYKNLKPITGVSYIKMPQGPVAAKYFETLTDLISDNEIRIKPYRRAQMISLRNDYNNTILSKKELDLIKNVCDKWKNKNTTEIVKFTHEQLPWKISFENDNIPYSLIIQQDANKLY